MVEVREAGPGEVAVELVVNDTGERVTHVMKSTLRAARAVSSMGAGFLGVFEGIRSYNMTIYVGVIAAGLGRREQKQIEEVEAWVYRTGLAPLAPVLNRFVNYLMSGGREPEKARPDDGEGEDEGK